MRNGKTALLLRVFALAAMLLTVAACGKPPKVGSPEFNRALKDGEVFIVTESVPNTGLRTAIAYGAAKCDIDAAWMMMMDFNRFDEFMDRLKEVKVIRREGNATYADVLISGFPLPDRQVIMKFTADRDTKTLDMDLQEVIVGPVNDVSGYSRIDDDLGDGYVRLTLYIFMDLDLPFFLNPIANLIAQWTLENWALAIRERIKEPVFQEYVKQAEAAKKAREEESRKAIDEKLKDLQLDL